MKRFHLVFLIILLINVTVKSQGEIDDQGKVLFFSETTYGFSLTTNGWSMDYRFAKDVTAFKKTLYTVEFSNVKDPKEKKSPSTSYPDGRSYVYGKLNTFMVLRGGFGLQKELFSKRDKGSVAIKYYYTAGPALGILKPMYYQIYSNSGEPLIEKFQEQHPNITGGAGFLKGLTETTFIPGLSAKTGYTFEFSTEKYKIQALEAAVNIDLYPKKIDILASGKNSFFFISTVLNYRFGVVNEKRHSTRRNKLDNLILE